MPAHAHTRTGICLSRTLERGGVLGVADCFGEGLRIYLPPCMGCLHLLLLRPFAKNPLSILSLHRLNTFCSFAGFCWLAEWSEKYYKTKSD